MATTDFDPDAVDVTAHLDTRHTDHVNAIRDLADRASLIKPHPLGEDALAFVTPQDYDLHRIDLHDYDEYLPAPRRAKGRREVLTVDSLNAAVSRYGTSSATTIWADQDASKIVAVLNDDEAAFDDVGQKTGWGDDEIVMLVEKTREWHHWESKDGQWMKQLDFADHLDVGANAVVFPDAATMIELAQSFRAKKNVDFKSDRRLDSGEVQLKFEETIAAKAGQTGTLEIPTKIALHLQPYRASDDSYDLAAWFRYRIVDGDLLMAYRLIRPEDVLDKAWTDIVGQVAPEITVPVYLGSPRPKHD